MSIPIEFEAGFPDYGNPDHLTWLKEHYPEVTPRIRKLMVDNLQHEWQIRKDAERWGLLRSLLILHNPLVKDPDVEEWYRKLTLNPSMLEAFLVMVLDPEISLKQAHQRSLAKAAFDPSEIIHYLCEEVYSPRYTYGQQHWVETLDKMDATLQQLMEQRNSLRLRLGLKEAEELFPERLTLQAIAEHSLVVIGRYGYRVELVDVGTGELRLIPLNPQANEGGN